MEPVLLSDLELLSLLVGKKAAEKLYRSSLTSLVTGDHNNEPHPKLVAAMELARRLLREKLENNTVLSSPMAVRDYLRLHFLGREHEAFVVILLDAQNRVLKTEELFRGTLTQTSVYPREIVKCALRANAAAVIFAHNHPSGIAEPSRADEMLTQSLKQALALVDVKVLDHFVVGGDSVMSFAERGLI